jgi:alpha-amylase/alpha-mannosidase (GH57 family)
MECFACIHCHFYQPPRENPWLETVESQDSANPYHDWNERIARECYLPNGASRILNPEYRIAKIVNNYAQISFNFGPSLLSWMEQRAPEGYQKILDGDRESQRLFSGHGGGLAQAYNHSILPLSNSRDKRTQIIWGIEDFKHRFKRDPEGMWLPETAVDLETLDILSAEGIKFTILAPRQAAQIRTGDKSSWIGLEYGVDSRRAYACHLPSGRTIGLFFYDGALATAVAFEKLLYSGENLARRLLSRYDPEGDSGQLMHVATDGETYGHHHAHGDMALAYALEYIRTRNLARTTNYGEYFALYPPRQEIRIHEKTSWSCAHGVARWESNCGCNSGTPSPGQQQWRRPLREAFDWLRDDLVADFERHAKMLFKNPWSARDHYISAVLDRAPENVANFLSKHSRHRPSGDEQVRALRLLELQRHLMLMYTSCGWFFDEPTGPETIQVLQYASRAVQLSEQLFGGDREAQFLQRLESVHSNIPEFGNGRQIYEHFVRPAMLDLPGVAAHYAISSFFEGYKPSDSIYAYEARLREVAHFEHPQLTLATGTVQIESRITHAQLDFNFAVLHAGGHKLRAGVCGAHADFSKFVNEMSHLLKSGFQSSLRALEHYFGRATYSLKSLFRDERRRIVSQIVDSTLADVDKLHAEVYAHNSALIDFLRELGMALPPILRVSSEFVLNNTIRRYLSPEEMDIPRVRLLISTAAQSGIALDNTVKFSLSERVEGRMQLWSLRPFELQLLTELEDLVMLVRAAPFEVDLWGMQNTYYGVMTAVAALAPLQLSDRWLDHFRNLGKMLNIGLPEAPLSAAEEQELPVEKAQSAIEPLTALAGAE